MFLNISTVLFHSVQFTDRQQAWQYRFSCYVNTQQQQYANMYIDCAQFLDNGRQCSKMVQNIIKLYLNSLPKLKTTVHMKHQCLNYSVLKRSLFKSSDLHSKSIYI